MTTEKRPLHPVSTKAILLSPDGKYVLGMKYFFEDESLYGRGLPGGHLEATENPDEAVVREIEEELGITVAGLERFSFTTHKQGKIVLLYKGTLSRDIEIRPSDPKREIGEWTATEDIAMGTYDFGSYTEGILDAVTQHNQT